MACIFAIDPRFQSAPLKLAGIAQIDLPAVVAGHVHALIGEALIWNVLFAKFEFQQVAIVAQRQFEGLVAGFVSGRADFVTGQPVAAGCGQPGSFEVLRRLVIVGCGC